MGDSEIRIGNQQHEPQVDHRQMTHLHKGKSVSGGKPFAAIFIAGSKHFQPLIQMD